MQLYEFKETQERVILIGVQTGVRDDVAASLDELDELAQTAGAETAAKVRGRLKKWHLFCVHWMQMA